MQALGVEGRKALQKMKHAKRVASEYHRRWQWLHEQLTRPFLLPWLPLDWAESEPEEDTIQIICASALEQTDQYL